MLCDGAPKNSPGDRNFLQPAVFGDALPYFAPTAFNQDSERMKFTGHERDLGSPGGAGDDLDYMHARHCSPVTGRFLSVDPYLDLDRATRSPQMWNRYAYVHGNPMNYVDPTGKQREDLAYEYSQKQRRLMAESQKRQSKALREIKKLQGTQAWKLASLEQRLVMIVQTAAKNTKDSQEALATAFKAVDRNGPFKRRFVMTLQVWQYLRVRGMALLLEVTSPNTFSKLQSL